MHDKGFCVIAHTTILHTNAQSVVYSLIKLADYTEIFSMLQSLHTVDQYLIVKYICLLTKWSIVSTSNG